MPFAQVNTNTTNKLFDWYAGISTMLSVGKITKIYKENNQVSLAQYVEEHLRFSPRIGMSEYQ